MIMRYDDVASFCVICIKAQGDNIISITTITFNSLHHPLEPKVRPMLAPHLPPYLPPHSLSPPHPHPLPPCSNLAWSLQPAGAHWTGEY